MASEAQDVKKRFRVPIKDLVTPGSSEKQIQTNMLNPMQFQSLVVDNAEALDDADAIMELLPDLELVQETLISCILSPKDLKEVNMEIGLHAEAPAEIAEIIKKHFKTEYDLNSQLADILTKALFRKGSHTLICIPPAAIRNMVRSNTYGLENLSEDQIKVMDFTDMELSNHGIIKSDNAQRYAMETVSQFATSEGDSKGQGDLLELSDNAIHFLRPLMKEALREEKLRAIMSASYGLEDLVPTQADLTAKGYADRSVKLTPHYIFDVMTNPDKVCNPIVLNPPPECIAVVHVPGEPEKHIGYWFALDEDGYFLKYSRSENRFKELSRRLDEKVFDQSSVQSLNLGISYPNATTNGKEDEKKNLHNLLLNAYRKKFEEELTQAVAKGTAGSMVEIGEPEEFYRIMMARQLEKQRTRMVYMPAEIVTYVAFNYNDAGQGVSLIEKSKLFASLRAVTMFATIMAGINGSINYKTLSIAVDDKDPDPYSTVRQVVSEYVAAQASGIPIGRINPLGIIDTLQKAGLQIKLSGGSNLPITDVEINEAKRDITPPQQELVDMIRDMHYASLWMNADVLSKASDIDLATAITASQLLQAKRVQKGQQVLTGHIARHMKQYINMGGPLMEKIKKKYQEVKTENSISLKEIIDSLTLVLPKADHAVIKDQHEQYTEYVSFIEEVIPAFIDRTMMDNSLTGDKTGGSIDDLKQAVLCLLKRQYLRSQNMLPELDSLVTGTESPIADLLENHNELIVKLAADALRHVHKTDHSESEKTNDLDEKLNPQEEESSTEEGGEEGGEPGEDDTGGEESEGGEDDFNEEGGDLNFDDTESDDLGGGTGGTGEEETGTPEESEPATGEEEPSVDEEEESTDEPIPEEDTEETSAIEEDTEETEVPEEVEPEEIPIKGGEEEEEEEPVPEKETEKPTPVKEVPEKEDTGKEKEPEPESTEEKPKEEEEPDVEEETPEDAVPRHTPKASDEDEEEGKKKDDTEELSEEEKDITKRKEKEEQEKKDKEKDKDKDDTEK